MQRQPEIQALYHVRSAPLIVRHLDVNRGKSRSETLKEHAPESPDRQIVGFKQRGDMVGVRKKVKTVQGAKPRKFLPVAVTET